MLVPRAAESKPDLVLGGAVSIMKKLISKYGDD